MNDKKSKKSILKFGLILAAIVLLVVIGVILREGQATEGGAISDSDQNGGIKAVLLGETPFFYCVDGTVETFTIADVPALFDADDPFMKIWEFSVVDLDGDGEEEVILFVFGVAGDTGGRMIFHQIRDAVYGYITDSRTLVDLKTDGTYNYSDPTGMAESGIAAFLDFSETGYTVDKITYATGTYEGWDAFWADRQSVTEEAYLEAVSLQEQKQNAEWYEFNDENIATW
ncbi:MAG: hypothetical protein NC417_14710 [Candidatus Gastranaerophilales bacterium]|nr:hypothetical protein [Candidatus Gastranaerophilales bacterium]